MQRAKPERSFRTVLLAGMGFLTAPVLPAQPAPCLVNFVSPLVVPVTGQLREVFIDDNCTHIYLANATTNQVEVFSLEALSLLAPIQVGSRPTGLDASPDGKTLYVANSGGNNISVVDLQQGVEKLKVPVPSGFSNDTPFSIAVASSGLAFFSTTFAGSGFGARMMQLEPSSYAVSQRRDFYINGTTTEATFLRASGDRSAIGVVAGDISSGPVFRYSSAANVFSSEKDLNAFINDVALDGKGSTLLVNPGTYVLNSSLSLAGTIPGGNFGVAVDPSGMRGYQVGPGGIDLLNLTSFTKAGSLAIGDGVGGASRFSHGVGTMTISRDGAILAVITDHGFSVIETSHLIPFAAMASSAYIQLHGGATPHAFYIEGSFTLGPGSRGIDPPTQDVLLQLGSASVRIPAGSFHQQGNFFTFVGTIGGVSLNVQFYAASSDTYFFAAVAGGVDLTGSSLPLSLGWVIGGDGGRSTLVSGFAELSSQP